MSDNQVPAHVAIVMDGNGRWAKKRFLPRAMGHRSGYESVRTAIQSAVAEKVKVLSLFAFSSENWQRPPEEVNQLMKLFMKGLQTEVAELHQQGVRMRFIGARAALDSELQEQMAAAENLTANNTLLQLVIAVNYGGQWDILQACQSMVQAVTAGSLSADQITNELFNAHLDTKDLPPVDLFIRTSGELRISNFFLWQLAYSELYFTDVLWPDFGPKEFKAALEDYSKRKRRFGKV